MHILYNYLHEYDHRSWFPGKAYCAFNYRVFCCRGENSIMLACGI